MRLTVEVNGFGHRYGRPDAVIYETFRSSGYRAFHYDATRDILLRCAGPRSDPRPHGRGQNVLVIREPGTLSRRLASLQLVSSGDDGG